MPLGTAEETYAGLPFKAVRPVRKESSLESLHVNLSLLSEQTAVGMEVGGI